MIETSSTYIGHHSVMPFLLRNLGNHSVSRKYHSLICFQVSTHQSLWVHTSKIFKTWTRPRLILFMRHTYLHISSPSPHTDLLYSSCVWSSFSAMSRFSPSSFLTIHATIVTPIFHYNWTRIYITSSSHIISHWTVYIHFRHLTNIANISTTFHLATSRF